MSDIEIADVLNKLEAAAMELPAGVQARRPALGGMGARTIVVPCLRSELLSAIAGARQVQARKKAQP